MIGFSIPPLLPQYIQKHMYFSRLGLTTRCSVMCLAQEYVNQKLCSLAKFVESLLLFSSGLLGNTGLKSLRL